MLSANTCNILLKKIFNNNGMFNFKRGERKSFTLDERRNDLIYIYNIKIGTITINDSDWVWISIWTMLNTVFFFERENCFRFFSTFFACEFACVCVCETQTFFGAHYKIAETNWQWCTTIICYLNHKKWTKRNGKKISECVYCVVEYIHTASMFSILICM